MKKILSFVLMAVCAVIAFAQSKMYVVKTDGTEIEYLVSEIDSIRFVKGNGDIQFGTPVEQTPLAIATYRAENEANDITFVFSVLTTEGHYYDKNQIVTISIYGNTYILSDEGASYLIYEDGRFYTARTAIAREKADKIVMCLACANSTEDYTITSATINTTMNANGATVTKFEKIN